MSNCEHRSYHAERDGFLCVSCGATARLLWEERCTHIAGTYRCFNPAGHKGQHSYRKDDAAPEDVVTLHRADPKYHSKHDSYIAYCECGCREGWEQCDCEAGMPDSTYEHSTFFRRLGTEGRKG